MTRYLAAPAYVLGLLAVTVGPLVYEARQGRPVPGFEKPKPPVVKADKFQDRFDALAVKPIIFRPPKVKQ